SLTSTQSRRPAMMPLVHDGVGDDPVYRRRVELRVQRGLPRRTVVICVAGAIGGAFMLSDASTLTQIAGGLVAVLFGGGLIAATAIGRRKGVVATLDDDGIRFRRGQFLRWDSIAGLR